MELDNDTPLEQRQITLALPPGVWEILDGTNKMVRAEGGQGLEEYVASLIMTSVLRCLDIAFSLAGSSYGYGREGSA